MNLSLFLIFFLVFIPKVFPFSTLNTIPYSDHCNSFVPEATATDDKVFTRQPFLEPLTTHYTGGQNILDHDSQRSIFFVATRNLFKTNVVDTYQIQALLRFSLSNIYHLPSNLKFHLDGFWSVSTNKMCMVGSATWFSKEGKSLKLDAVLKLNFARFITLETSLVSGILKSLAEPHDSNYFDPISMLGFHRVAPFMYNYTLVSNQECKSSTLEDSVTSIQSLGICPIFLPRFVTYKLEHPTSCKNCSLFGQDSDYLPTFVSLYAIQCASKEKKLRFLIEFQDRRFTPYYQSFNPNISLIGEGTWNGTKEVLCITACRILNQSDPLGSARVGDCSIRLTLWFPAVRSIMKTHNTEGQIWTTKLTDETGSFRTVKFQSFDHSPENYGWKYEYTQMEKVKRVCPKKKNVGDKYQFGYYGFDMSVKHKNLDSTGSAVPIFVGDHMYSRHHILNRNFSPWKAAAPPVSSVTSYGSRQNISFEISFRLNFSSNSRRGISSLSLSSSDDDKVKISAEGFYDSETGEICMVGCRNINTNNTSFDCEIAVKFHLPRGNGSFLKGSIESLREKRDVLYFEHLDIFSLTYTETEVRKMIWRIDLEIIMVLISDTLVCVFIGQQLFHLKKDPEMASSISVFTMLILTLGYMIPLMLNFEAIFSNIRSHQNIPLGTNGGWVEMNEVVVRIVTMVAFILQFRLLQLTWIAKQNNWIHEIWTLVIYLPAYIIGGLAMLVLNRKNNNFTINLRSYAGLTLDGFLFPQLIHNILQNSKGNALCYSFFIGTTFVRLVPHVYDRYRGPKNISHQFDRLYIYANPRADFYSPYWDIVIVCGGVVLAVINFLQQCFGGRFVFPKRFRETVEYEMHFVDLVIGYFRDHAHGILATCKAYTKGVKVGCAIDSGEEAGSQWFKSNVEGYMKTLIGAFKEIGAENVDEFMPPTPKSLAQKIWDFFKR
ncbi:hypothetical protein CTI12_AA330670 [Artemisia annua]|uniref:RING-type E3 ubiquitin transferase n=1 Tax=Artemisia annua TaxID=35608 RepID=A0A2U1MY42_ARTAN|nr:hypothetical protein CTI12_AA330670 [Artemisia annua]